MMRKSSRRRQKTRSSCQVETDNRADLTPQHFQITVNVIEARKLAWNNSQSPTSYVVIVLGQKTHRTNIRQNVADPCFRQSFVFEMCATAQELQRSSIWLAVKEPRCCAQPLLLGEAIINLGAIWAHSIQVAVFSRSAQNGSAVRMRTAVRQLVTPEQRATQASNSDDACPTSELLFAPELVKDILLPSGMEQTRANYMITIHGAFALPSGQYSYGERRYGKPPSTFVRVSFCGLMANTGVHVRNTWPTYNELVSIVEMFPNVSQDISLEVCSTEGCNRVLASSHLRLDLISHDGENGFLPTFGPSLLHMYGNLCPGSVGYTAEDGPCHRGALLVALNTVVPFYQRGLRTINVEPASLIKTKNLWLLEDFCVFCPILEVSMLDRRIVGTSCGVAITIGQIFSDIKENCELRKLHYTGSMDVTEVAPVYGCLDFPHGFPVLQLATRLPDLTFRMYRNNIVHGIVSTLETALKKVELRLQSLEYAFPSELLDDLNKAIEDTIGNILKFLDIIQDSSSDVTQQCSTELDLKQLSLQKDEMEKIFKQLSTETRTNSLMSLGLQFGKGTRDGSVKRKAVKVLLAECKTLMENLRKLIFKSPDGWPDIVLWLLSAGSRVAYCKISPADIIFSINPEQNGRHCGRIQTIYFKPLKCPKDQTGVSSACNCIIGKADLLLWMGQCKQSLEFDKYLPTGYHLKIREYVMALKCSSVTMLECRCFLYRTKLNNMVESKFPYSFVRMHALGSVTDTKIKQKISSPNWNEILKIRKMLYITQERLSSLPPLVLIEVYASEISVLESTNFNVGRLVNLYYLPLYIELLFIYVEYIVHLLSESVLMRLCSKANLF